MLRDDLMARWTDYAGRIVALAEEFPSDRYDARPVPEIRTFADQLRHVAFWNHYVRQKLRGEHADGAANELPREAFPTKAAIVPALRESFDGVRAELAGGRGDPDPAAVDTLVSFIGHGGEHYGQLVLYYRLNGMVPPASRAP